MLRKKRPSEETLTQKCIRIPEELRVLIEERIGPTYHPDLGVSDLYVKLLEDRVNEYTHEESGIPILGRDAGQYPHIRLSRLLREVKPFSDIDLPDTGPLRYAADISGKMVWMGDANGKNIYVSPPLLQYTGCFPDYFRQDGWKALVHPEDQTKTVNRYAEILRTHTPFRFGYRFLRADGYWGCILDYAQPRFHADGRFAGFVGTMVEVSVEAPTRRNGRAIAS